ncbi:hypothetical protein ABFX02_10G167800 [Erythranthe guttata]
MSDDNNLPKVENEDAFQSLLELAANDDLEAFRTYIDRRPLIVNDVGLWYGRQNGPARMALHHLTPLMVASTYGSLDVVNLILSRPGIDVNKSSGADKSTALHCAAAGGSIRTVEIVRALLSAGADPNLTDVNGRKPIDVIFVPPKPWGQQVHYSSLRSMLATMEEYIPLSEKEYSVDAVSMPDIKNGIYSTDEFRMFSFKIRPCSRAYSHDWTECPFVHPGENARRRDPRKFHYSCVACPDFRKGACRRGDMCEYAHGVFECWLHPAQYRTRLCKDGTSCSRRVCFFAHKQEELRPLYVSTCSGVASPRSIAASPSPFTPPMSPSNQNVPALHLPGSSNLLSSSRLRSSLNARIFADTDMNANLPNRSLRPVTLMTHSNLEDMFSSDVYSPRHIQHQQQGMLSPINATFSSGRMSPRHHHVDSISPMLARSKWGPPEGAVAPDDSGKLERCPSFEALNNGEEPDLSWVHSLVRESSQDVKKEISGHGFAGNEGENSNDEIEQIDQSVLGAWLEQMQLDQLIAQ